MNITKQKQTCRYKEQTSNNEDPTQPKINKLILKTQTNKLVVTSGERKGGRCKIGVGD